MEAFLDVLLAVLGGAIRVGTPFLFVSLGGCLTGKSGRINLGLEGVLVFSAMTGFGGAYLTGSPWLGVLVAGAGGALLALLHGLVCSLPRVNDIAMGIALMMLGAGLAFYLGKPLIQPQAPQIPSIALGGWSDSQAVQVALVIFARWIPVRCLGAALLFGGAGALGPALQSVGVSGFYHLFNVVPYGLTLAVLVWTCSPERSPKGAPMELGVSR